ncbi:3-oxoacyl-ACP synthase III [Nocardioides sp. CFH 31398]|uniref:3-oxoacyl-ACP synthase III n=1 Tax=Nocardioides sp. CFH 31398 TaxID=2919579 RepID=UPI001F057450|nr:3-oxoacyl-ACP synthase III [Nocardioides sp. CFH 31398]MCH1867486.1 3-oxoacyl-ACP synthase III [Nocardioides sp. CFH 31398]
MSQNSTHHYTRASVLSVERVEAPVRVTSAEIDDRLTDVYRRTRMRGGLLESLVGIRERRWWGEGEDDADFVAGAAAAGQAALAASRVPAERIGLMVNTSLSRHWLEPATAVVIHDRIGLPTSCQNFDTTNACLGFMNGIEIAATMIETGMIDYALVVDAEDSRPVSESTIERLSNDVSTSRDVMSEFAALTLGSGAVAMVLGPAEDHPEGHRVVAAVSRAGTEHHELCVGDNESMVTDLKGLLEAGLDLSDALWTEAARAHGWDGGMDRYVIHQVSQVHTDALCDRLGIDKERVPRTFPEYGNIGPASVPFTLAGEAGSLASGDRVLLMGIGSGLNACVLELAW